MPSTDVHQKRAQRSSRFTKAAALLGLFCLLFLINDSRHSLPRICPHTLKGKYPYGKFPKKDDAFHFIPCTQGSLLPALDDKHHVRSWAKRYDPNPENWSWGNDTDDQSIASSQDPFRGRGIYLCGYLDVPLDYGNKSDDRIVRLAVTKYQVSGLKHRSSKSNSRAGKKSARTLVIEPGGPGGSGTSMTWSKAEAISKRFTDGAFDVLGWDPRGVNASLPSTKCFPHNAHRDRWALYANQYIEQSHGGSPRPQLEILDAMNDAIFNACKEVHDDFPRFVSTALVARDLEEIRIAMGEDELTGYLVSYGTGIGQTYANMFPDSVGRLILDGTEYVRDHRLLGGFGWTALDNATAAWHDGFLGECVNAGPEHCALAESLGNEHPVQLEDLDKRMKTLLQSILQRPAVGYTEKSGPSIITYNALMAILYQTLYAPERWPEVALMLAELEKGNTTRAAHMVDKTWGFDPTVPPTPIPNLSEELGSLVICADSYDAPLPNSGLDWWESLWVNMTETTWVSGNSRFMNVFPCRHFTKYWPEPAEVYRGDLNSTLKHPVLLIGETYDPATPLRNGRRLLAEMGRNARLIAHHGYGHSSRDTSACTEKIARDFIMHGILPDEPETACFADEKPYRYSKLDGKQQEWERISLYGL